jgi:hypothetical protein
VQVRLERTALKEVAHSIKLAVREGDPAVVVTLDSAAIAALHMHVDARTVRCACYACALHVLGLARYATRGACALADVPNQLMRHARSTVAALYLRSSRAWLW